MCGRFTSTTTPGELASWFGAEQSIDDALGPRFNVAPTDPVAVVAETGSARRLGPMRWGLVPWWATSAREGSRFINARAETVRDKPAFARAFERRRCIVPVDGFYEWSGAAPGAGRRASRQPWYIHRTDGEVLAFAGLWSRWRPPDAPEDAEPMASCTIITTKANERIAPVHDRMPVVLAPSSWDRWLDFEPDADVAGLVELLRPAPSELFELRRVSTAVNDVRHDGPSLIEPAPPVELFPDPA